MEVMGPRQVTGLTGNRKSRIYVRVTLMLVGIAEHIRCRALELQALIAFVCVYVNVCMIHEVHVCVYVNVWVLTCVCTCEQVPVCAGVEASGCLAYHSMNEKTRT